jgi:hypothetical protein
MNKLEKDFKKTETKIMDKIDNKIINSLENYKDTRPSFFSNISWKIIITIGLILLAIIIFFLLIFRNFLKKNIKDELFLNILDIIYILLLVNICIAIFTITNYYYRTNKVGTIGPPGIQGKPGKRGLDKKCDIFSRRINKFEHEKVPENLLQRIKANFIPPHQVSAEMTPNKWYLCIDNKVDANNSSQIQHFAALYNKSLAYSNCLKNGTCLKVSRYAPPNNRPINGCIINVDNLNKIIHALQFTYEENLNPIKNIDDIKLVGMNNTCSAIKKPFKNETDKKNNYDKYIAKILINEQRFTKEQLDKIYTYHSENNGNLNYICNVTDFYEQFNIAYISFKPIDDNYYEIYGTAIYKNGEIVFKENYKPIILCRSCKYSYDHQLFLSVCNDFNSIDKCINNNCIWKNNLASECNEYNEVQCKNNSEICSYDTESKTCNGISKCEGESIGNYNLQFTEISSFKAPPGSAIYKIETYNTLDDGNKPGVLKGIKFYCRDIITSEDVLIKDENGNKNLYICFGYNIDDNIEKTNYLNVNVNSFTAPISSTPDNTKTIIKYYPSFISSTSVLYDNLNIIGLEINSCVYYKND